MRKRKNESYWDPRYVEMTCARCGKTWHVRAGWKDSWGYRIEHHRRNGHVLNYYCTWTCKRAAEKEEEEECRKT